MVECNLAKVDVAGSTPVSRSIFFWRLGQVVRRRPAKPLFSSSNLEAASIQKKRRLRMKILGLFLCLKICSCRTASFGLCPLRGGFDSVLDIEPDSDTESDSDG